MSSGLFSRTRRMRPSARNPKIGNETVESLIPNELDEYFDSVCRGPVKVAKRKVRDPFYFNVLKALLLAVLAVMLYYAYYNFDGFHTHITHGYARIGYPEAQHMLGQRYLQGKGVTKNKTLAMEWFEKAALQGHAHAAYNLAIGHFQGVHRINDSSDVYNYLFHASQNGVAEASAALKHFCQEHDCTS